MNNWTNHKIKIKVYNKQSVDIETGELIPEEKLNEYDILKTEYNVKYSISSKITTRTYICTKRKQLTIWG